MAKDQKDLFNIPLQCGEIIGYTQIGYWNTVDHRPIRCKLVYGHDGAHRLAA